MVEPAGRAGVAWLSWVVRFALLGQLAAPFGLADDSLSALVRQALLASQLVTQSLG